MNNQEDARILQPRLLVTLFNECHDQDLLLLSSPLRSVLVIHYITSLTLIPINASLSPSIDALPIEVLLENNFLHTTLHSTAPAAKPRMSTR